MSLNPPMDYSQDGYAVTKYFESCKLTAYPDPGTHGDPWTIGWGHTHGVHPGMTCTQEQADAWIEEDMKFAMDAVNELVDVPLTQGQFDALVDFVYNVGKTKFSNSTLLDKLNSGEYDQIDGELTKWVNAGGHPLPGLVKRRSAEAKLFDDEPPPTA